MTTIDPTTVYSAAASLTPDGGTPNPEYERALVELAATLTGDEHEDATMHIIEHGGHFAPATPDRSTATTLRAAARALRDHADDVKTIGMVGQSYKLGVQDAALILTRKADDLDPQDDPGTTDGDFGGGSDADRDDWDVPLGEGYEGPSITTRVSFPSTAEGNQSFTYKLPPPPASVEYVPTDEEGVYQRITPHHHDWRPNPDPTIVDTGNSPLPSWSPRYGYPPAPKGERAPIHGPQFDDDGNPTGLLPAPIDQHAPVKYGSDWQTGLVHGPRLGGYINLTDDDQPDNGQPYDGPF